MDVHSCRRPTLPVAVLAIGIVVSGACRSLPATRYPPPAEWPSYGRDPGGSRYSPADQITRENVARLRVAWTYRTGDWSHDGNTRSPANSESTPIFVEPIDARLIALDAATGRPCLDFGDSGVVSLRRGLLNGPAYASEYQITSPPAVVGDVVVVGSTVADNNRVDAASGEVRAFDARSGALRWSWDPVPRDSAVAAAAGWRGPAAWRTGAANTWGVIAADPARDLVFVPTSSPSPDYYGGRRLGDNRGANSVVALRASTGQVVWQFQVVHHDLWDYDVPAQPILTTLRRAGRDVPALVQLTKMGLVFVLDRETGRPMFPVEERAVPRSTAIGEEAWPTQPFPVLPTPIAPSTLTAADAWG